MRVERTKPVSSIRAIGTVVNIIIYPMVEEMIRLLKKGKLNCVSQFPLLPYIFLIK